MKIGIYLQTWHVGGVAVFCERLARGLHQSGHEPCLVVGTPFGKRDTAARAAFERLSETAPFPVLCLHSSAYHPVERPWRAAEAMAGLECDVILLSAHLALAPAFPFLASRSALAGIAHTDDEDSYAEFRAAAPYCAAYAGVSAAIVQSLNSQKPPGAALRLCHLPYGVPPGTETGAAPGGPARILVVCRLVQRQKRVLDLPPLWREYLRQGGQGALTICGPGEEEGRLRQLLAAEIATQNVTLTGAVPLERMPELYAGHDILLSVSAYEGLPLVVLEAASAGLYPVLSNIRSGHPEIVQALGHGRLCEPGNTAEFASALRELSGRVVELRALRPALREAAQSRFGLARMVESYVQMAAEASAPRAQAGGATTRAAAVLARPKVDFFRRWLRHWQYSRHYGWSLDCRWPASSRLRNSASRSP